MSTLRKLTWVMLGALLMVLPVDWDEQPEWGAYRERRCEQYRRLVSPGLHGRRAEASGTALYIPLSRLLRSPEPFSRRAGSLLFRDPNDDWSQRSAYDL